VVLLIFFLGLVFGSFVGVLTWRLPRGKQFLLGRSICPHCKHQIAWFDNIPLVSFLALKGRCRHCRARISRRYPAVELALGVLFVLLYLRLLSCPSPETVCLISSTYALPGILFLFFVLLLNLSIFVIDLERRIIPDELVFAGLATLTVLLVLGPQHAFYLRLFAAFLAALLLLALNIATKGKGMGLGDVKYALFGGLFFGWPLSLVWLLTAFLTGALAAIILILTDKAGMKDKIAFGPFLAISFVIVMFFGERILGLLWL